MCQYRTAKQPKNETKETSISAFPCSESPQQSDPHDWFGTSFKPDDLTDATGI